MSGNTTTFHTGTGKTAKCFCAALSAFAIATAVLAGAEPPPLRMAYNYCTLAYTFAFYSDAEWKAEIERLAKAGYNAALVIDGTFKVWQDTLRELGADEGTIAAFIPDECARPWWLMGNLAGEGGPIDQPTIDDDARRGREICRMMREHGIEPVLQGYVGMLPAGFGDNLIEQGAWGPYEQPPLLDPTSPRFAEVAAVWYRSLERVYGFKPKFLAGDLFHEGGASGDIDVTAATCAVQTAQQRAFPGVVWMVQAWQKNPVAEVRAGLDPRFTVIEALVKDLSQTPHPLDYGQLPWIWCELLNFGGNHGIYGNLRTFARLGECAGGETFRGYGSLSEGFFTNPVCSDLFEEMMRRPAGSVMNDAELEEWLRQWHEKRYGVTDERITEAWRLLARSAYSVTNKQEGAVENVMCAKPSWKANNVSAWGPKGGLYYESEDVSRAYALLREAAEAQGAAAAPALLDDVADVGRQVVANEARRLAPLLMRYPAARRRFLALFPRLAKILDGRESFSLAAQEARARRRAGQRGVDAFRRMVTSWSAPLPEGEANVLEDYAHREYRELVLDYYLPRWKKFFDDATKKKGSK